MFSIFKSKKSSPNRADDGQPPVPGPETENYVVIDKANDPSNPESGGGGGGGGLYPSAGAAPIMPAVPKREAVGFLHGVPFKLSKEFSGDSEGDMVAIQISQIMAHCAQGMRFDNLNYDFNVEKSVLTES